MNKDKELEEMVDAMPSCVMDKDIIAIRLINSGYGKVEDYKKQIETDTEYEKNLNKVINKYLEKERTYKKEIERLKEENKLLKNAKSSFDWVIDKIKEREQQAIKEVLEKITTHIFKYLGVKDIKEANNLSLIDSTLTYDVVIDEINDLLKEYNIGE